MELENTIENENDANQPGEVVVTESEITEAKPQADATDEQEIFFDDSSDDQEESHKKEMSQAQSYAAFQKKKKQSAKRLIELNESKERESKLQRELNELKAEVGNITRGEMPDPLDFDDKHEHYEALKKWESKAPVEKAKAEPEAKAFVADEEAEFYLYQKEQELTKHIPGYTDAKANVVEALKKADLNPEASIDYLSQVARQKGVDIAKVFFAMDKSPKILNDLKAAGNNAFAIADILTVAEKKVKTRAKVAVESKPEPNITNSGPIDATSETIKKARKAWVDNPTNANFKLYQSAKNKGE